MTIERDEREDLEQTQEMLTSGVHSGVYRVRESSNEDSWRRAPELSVKYPSISIDFLRKQAD